MAVDLKNIATFRGLSEAKLRALASKAVTRSVLKNVVVITEGEFTRSLYMIISGKVKVYLTDESGKELVLDVKGPGEYFGEMVLDDGPRSASIMTLEPCQFAVITMADFKTALLENPEIALQVITNLIRMTRGLNENVRSLALLDVYGRVARMLLDMAVERGGQQVVQEKLTQQEMANKVGTSREVINRILRDLTTGGYIKIEDKTITIVKRLPSKY